MGAPQFRGSQERGEQMKARLISTGACVLVGASAFLGGCVGVPPAVNPTVEVWDVQPSANTDIADVIIEQLVDQVFSLASSDNDSGCLFWCFHERGTRPSYP